jgi:iron(III) transport system ATP-binding protein
MPNEVWQAEENRRPMSIQIRNLRKTFGDTTAVEGLSLDIAEGEMLVLLGPSGCGKTTTMRCIAGLDSPDRGQISIAGRTVFDDVGRVNVAVNQRHVGMVFQSYAIWPHMSVAENVAFPLEMAGTGRAEIADRVEEMLVLVGLGGLGSRGASYLSGGQMQRVALARSLVMKPAVLLFDEPLSNLDARLRDHLRVQVRELQTQLKITSVYVTHDQREALALADRIAVMNAGAVLQTGDPVGLYHNPASSRIAEFLGYTNIFAVDAATPADAGGSRLRLRSGEDLVAARTDPPAATDLAACVRPDDVRIDVATGSGGDLAANSLAGEVLLASFMGSHMQYRVRVRSGAIWDVLSARIATDIKLGAQVVLQIPPKHILLLPES